MSIGNKTQTCKTDYGNLLN